jgi:hypothetical protein
LRRIGRAEANANINRDVADGKSCEQGNRYVVLNGCRRNTKDGLTRRACLLGRHLAYAIPELKKHFLEQRRREPQKKGSDWQSETREKSLDSATLQIS